MNIVIYVIPTVMLLLLGVWGMFVERKNMVITLISIELMLFAIQLFFIFFSIYLDDIVGQTFALFLLAVAASESAIGLALIVSYYKLKGNIDIEFLSQLKG